MSKDEATVNSSFSVDLTFTLTKTDDTTTTVFMKSSSRYTQSSWLAFPEDFTVATDNTQDIYLMATSWRYNTFPGTIDQESVQTDVYFDIFGQRVTKTITLKNAKTTYKATIGDPQVNGLTATIEVTIANNVTGYGQGYTGLKIAVENYSTNTTSYPVRAENCEITTSVESVDLANDLQGGTVTFTITIKADKAGNARFYIRLYNL